MANFILNLKKRAQALNKRILFPESSDLRILEAVSILHNEKICTPILIGNPSQINSQAQTAQLNLNGITIINPDNYPEKNKFINDYYELRKEKGLTLDQAKTTLDDPNYFANFLLLNNIGDGIISGANSSTGDTIRPSLQIIKSKPTCKKVSSVFFMILNDKIILFADCAIQIDPTSEDLAEIAIETAETAKQFELPVNLALLSFSTNGSAVHPAVHKVQQAVEIIRRTRPDLTIEGEMQADAALIDSIREKKFPNSSFKSPANILIFPDLNSGNIAYKLVERLAGATAVGPVLQGLNKPVNDLSRGCKVQDIVDLAIITSCQV